MFDSPAESQRILVVDDNTYTLRIVKHTLEMAGYEVTTAVSGEDALKMIHRYGMPHLALVDLHMPMMSGFEFCREVREFSDMPIIMLTAVNTEETIIEGLEKYAEDYIVKPFNSDELAARVGRVLRRMSNYNYTLESTTRIDGRLQVNFPNREAIVDGETVSLTPTENKLLYILVRNAGRIVTTDFLLNRIWPMQDAQEDRLHVHIHRLRRKIETDHNEPTYIIAERGTGYRFNVKPER
ncbi:MAG TPA: response regulator transcription factor [Anaerolineae bacterium]|nr:response regulator transcription factor [Anaerolineae bacterium]HIP70039.1 response regulator transcription factor [Anaerolineae bacterium]